MEKKYAALQDRIKAVVIDAIVVIAAMYGASEIFNLFDAVPDYARIIAAVVILILYDPFFTSQFGGTIGHSYSKIEVKREKDLSKNIPFPSAILRFLIKSTLGWLSLLTTTSNPQKKAIHDFAVSSVVINSAA